jgi:hypothetical protein
MKQTERLRLKPVNLYFNPIELSMIVSTLNNAMLSYMSVFHFDQALKCADFILDTYHKDAEFFFRKA